jgi:Na+-transporting methylmalonyl-CoA/oxaloacetate decarboxylase gamma subunit
MKKSIFHDGIGLTSSGLFLCLVFLIVPILGLSAFANSSTGKAVYASFEAWRTAPPACEYRLVPQRDGSILAYRC